MIGCYDLPCTFDRKPEATCACHAGVELEDKLPEHEYRDLFKPEDRLHISVSYEHENLNTREYLDSLQQKLFNNLSRCGNFSSKQRVLCSMRRISVIVHAHM